MHRRTLLSGSAALAVWAAAGCDRPAFESLDITGAPYGRHFKLLDTEGRTRTLADYRGRVLLLFFGFTQCPDICPTALSRGAEVMALLGTESQRVQVAFVSVDPERDLPEVLREYTRAFHPSFIGLHADLETTAATARDFKVFYKKVPTGASYTMDHTAISYAFDPQGQLRLAIRHEQTAASVAADLRRLLKEAA